MKKLLFFVTLTTCFSVSSFADTCDLNKRELSHIMGVSARSIEVAELSEGSYTVTAQTPEKQISYIVFTDENCKIIDSCVGSESNSEECETKK